MLDHGHRRTGMVEEIEEQPEGMLDLLIGVEDELTDRVVDQSDGRFHAEFPVPRLFQLAPQQT